MADHRKREDMLLDEISRLLKKVKYLEDLLLEEVLKHTEENVVMLGE